jgi:predicted nucleic acid-binding protein
VQSALADSGLFIGLFDANDKHHAHCAAFIESYRGRLITTWQVLTEALAILSARQQARLLTWIHRGVSSSLIRIECTDPLSYGLVSQDQYLALVRPGYRVIA